MLEFLKIFVQYIDTSFIGDTAQVFAIVSILALISGGSGKNLKNDQFFALIEGCVFFVCVLCPYSKYNVWLKTFEREYWFMLVLVVPFVVWLVLTVLKHTKKDTLQA